MRTAALGVDEPDVGLKYDCEVPLPWGALGV